MAKNNFNPCRYCGGNEQRFTFAQLFQGGNMIPQVIDADVVCACGNRTMKSLSSLDSALNQWNRENPVEEAGE
jgi:hypothetical protein